MKTVKYLCYSLIFVVILGGIIINAAPADLVYQIEVIGEINPG